MAAWKARVSILPECKVSSPALSGWRSLAMMPIKKSRGSSLGPVLDNPLRIPQLTMGTPTKKAKKNPIEAKVSPMVAPWANPKPSQTLPTERACPGPSSNPRGAKKPKVGKSSNPHRPTPMTRRPPTAACKPKQAPCTRAIQAGPLRYSLPGDALFS